MRRFALAAALAVLALSGSSAPAHAQQQVNQTLTFSIVGAGSITGPNGLSCSRTFGGPHTGQCFEMGQDAGQSCDGRDPPTCVPIASATFLATPADGWRFVSWTHPQCQDPLHDNPCSPQVAAGAGNPDLAVTARFDDVQAPRVTLTSPADGAVVRGTLPLTANATDNAEVTRLAFTVNGDPFQTFPGPPFATSVDTTTLGDGRLTVSATANDAVGLSDTRTAAVTIDNTKPTLAVTGPDGVTLGPPATPAWTVDAHDATALTVRCSVVVQGGPPSFGACTSATQERLVNQPDGRYTLTVRATDAAGNFVDQTRTFGIDTGPPETTIGSGPDDGTTTTATALTWGFAASEPSAFECRLFVTAVSPGPFGPCSAADSDSVAALAPGGYTFEVRARDAFGNVDPTPAHRTVTVTLPPPPPPPPTLPPPSPPPPSPPPPRPLRVVTVTLAFNFDGDRPTTRLTRLVVDSVPVGATVTALCPKSCARKRLVVRKPSREVPLTSLTRGKALKPRTTITVTVTKPGAVAAVKVLEIRNGRPPTVLSFCLPPGARRPRACA